MKKPLFKISFCLSLFCSSFACSQQTISFNALKKITPETIQTVAQEIEKLTPEEKLVLKEHVLETIEQLSKNEKVISHILIPTLGTLMLIQLCCCSFVPCVICALTCTTCYLGCCMCNNCLEVFRRRAPAQNIMPVNQG